MQAQIRGEIHRFFSTLRTKHHNLMYRMNSLGNFGEYKPQEIYEINEHSEIKILHIQTG